MNERGGDDLFNNRAEIRLVKREFHGDLQTRKRTKTGFARGPLDRHGSNNMQRLKTDKRQFREFLGKELTRRKEGIDLRALHDCHSGHGLVLNGSLWFVVALKAEAPFFNER